MFSGVRQLHPRAGHKAYIKTIKLCNSSCMNFWAETSPRVRFKMGRKSYSCCEQTLFNDIPAIILNPNVSYRINAFMSCHNCDLMVETVTDFFNLSYIKSKRVYQCLQKLIYGNSELQLLYSYNGRF